MARLLVAERGKTWVLDLGEAGRVVVGRGRKSGVRLEEPKASREHCAVEKDAEGFWLSDLESRNGTRLNGRKVRKRALLRPGDQIEIGSARLVFEAPAVPGAEDVLSVDPDTGLRSFAFVRAELDHLLGEGAVALAKLDVDALGLLNQVYGRDEGDATVAAVARVVAAAVDAIEPGAILGRETGGRLVLALGKGSIGRVRELAEEARAKVAAAGREGGLPVPSVTLSAGIAIEPRGGSARDLLRRADEALEDAKRRGRDRVAVPSDEELPPVREGALDETIEAPRLLLDTESSGELEPLLIEPAGQRALALVSHALASDLDLTGLAEFALGVVARETRATRGLLVLRDASGELRLGAAVSPGNAVAPTAPASHGIVRAALERKGGVLLEDALADEELGRNESVVAAGARSVVAAPIPGPVEPQGAIYLENNAGPGLFTRAHLDLVRAFGRLVAGPIRRGLLHRQALDELARARLALRGTRDEDARLFARFQGIIGRSDVVKKLLRSLDRVADRPLPVLIQGESGTGKELVARALHARSRRARGPFVAENCAALPDELLEAELFGWRKGAFTGADRDRTGVLEAAHEGTLFLDEVGDMSPRLQAKLLRFLELGELRRLGDEETRKVSVRVVAATNRDLEQMVAKGEFREDLFYRLAVVRVKLPPLRERREDVPLLIEHLAGKASRELGRAAPKIAPEALEVLAAHDWPGNVRQLENEVRKLVALGLPEIGTEQLSKDVLGARGGAEALEHARGADLQAAAGTVERAIAQGRSMEEALSAVEREVLARMLEATKGNRSEAARRLGLSRPGLRKKLRRFGLDN